MYSFKSYMQEHAFWTLPKNLGRATPLAGICIV